MPITKNAMTSREEKRKKAKKMERQKQYMWIFIGGKQVRVKLPPAIDGIPEAEWVARNADPIWLHQNEMWAELYASCRDVSVEIDLNNVEDCNEGHDLAY